jgi:hypothetical protein
MIEVTEMTHNKIIQGGYASSAQRKMEKLLRAVG